MSAAALTCSWKKVVPIFVEGHSHDAVSQVKSFLHAIAVVNVYVDVEHPGVVSVRQTPSCKDRKDSANTHTGRWEECPLTWAAPVYWWRCHWRNRTQTPANTQSHFRPLILHSLTECAKAESNDINMQDFVQTSNFLAWCKPPAQLMAMSQIWKTKYNCFQYIARSSWL